ncbi:MAG: UDP-N-acetylmuramoyl-L-alanine--D-glutamate ligase [Armatimonadetes bacterium]|nr:UDP-N-acetylmuramoyl-L-alanine--D-glutamate ligase [Armatimonadota bacterium]
MSKDRMPEHLRGKNVHVVGLSGTEGSTVVDFLVGRGATSLVAHDFLSRQVFPENFRRHHQWLPEGAQEEAIRRILACPIAYRFGDDYLKDILTADVIFATQAWFRYPQNAPLREAQRAGIPFSSMTHLFFETCPCPILGVTGTNGKFTTAVLIEQMLRRAGHPVVFSGNDRTHVPMLYRLDEITPRHWLVLEISNRQLIGLPYSPRLAVVTNVVPHHLDDHGSMEAYAEVKRTIVRHQGPDDLAVLNFDNPHTRVMGETCRSRVHYFSRTQRVAWGACVEDGQIVIVDGDRREPIVLVADLRVPGAHTVENALAASVAAHLAGAPADAIRGALREFRGLPYRLHLAAEADAVRYYEDSLATNPSAAAAGIRAMDRPVVLIAGGVRRDATPDDFLPMVEALAAGRVRGVLLIGATGPVLEAALRRWPGGNPPPVHRCRTLEAAVDVAQTLVHPGDAVLLSPGCESFDLFRDYRHRGDRFRELVEGRARTPGGAEDAGGTEHSGSAEDPRTAACGEDSPLTLPSPPAGEG